MAERNGSALRLRLRSAERLSEHAMARGSFSENTPLSRSRASLVSLTRCDQRLAFFLGLRVFFEGGILYSLCLFECSRRSQTTRIKIGCFRVVSNLLQFHHDHRC